MKVYIWGTGNMAENYLSENELLQEDIIGFIESRRTKKSFHGKKVFEPAEIVKSEYDYIIACVNCYGRDIYDTCKALNIDTGRLILVDNWEWMDGSPMNRPFKEPRRKIMETGMETKTLFPKLNRLISENDAPGQYIVAKRNCTDFGGQGSLMLQPEFQGTVYQVDYFRYRTFELMAREILEKEVEGSVAELGVFKGTFSKVINAVFSERKLYLFDTFVSFNKEEFQREMEAGRCDSRFFDIFTNTSIDEVLSVMEYPRQCIVRQGLFPATAEGLENETYAFVSIDVDFEQSILEGLKYFYPRLSDGGAIFVHDYSDPSLKGVKTAVDAYQKEAGKPLCKVPIADRGGTLVIVE